MRTDRQVHQLLAATPELIFTLADISSPGPCTYESVTQKEVEHRLDGLIYPADRDQPETVVEIQFYFDALIYERVVSEVYLRRLANRKPNVEGIILFARSDLDLAHHPARPLLTIVYLDEALQKLAERIPAHPAVAAFAPLWITDRPQVAEKCKAWYDTIRQSSTLNPAQRTRYEEVFLSWLLQRLGLKNLKDLDMLITDLPDLEDTDFYRLVLQKGREKGNDEGKTEGLIQALLVFGRGIWGVEPRDISTRLQTLSVPQLEELIGSMPLLSDWQALQMKLVSLSSH